MTFPGNHLLFPPFQREELQGLLDRVGTKGGTVNLSITSKLILTYWNTNKGKTIPQGCKTQSKFQCKILFNSWINLLSKITL